MFRNASHAPHLSYTLVAMALLLGCLPVSPIAGKARAEAAPPRWWVANPMRILVGRCNARYRENPVTEQQLRDIREAGFNVYGDRWYRFEHDRVERTLNMCKDLGLYYAPWFRGSMGNEEVLDKQIVWPSGTVQPIYGPLAPELWAFLDEWIEYYARMSAEWPLVGVMLDFENYAQNKQANLYASVSYDITSLRLYAGANGIAGPPEDLRPEQARQWVQTQPEGDWAGYVEWFREQFRQRCRNLRQIADRHNPQFLFMVYLAPGLTGEIAAAEWSTEAAPFVLAGVDYGRPFPYLSERLNLLAIEQRIRDRRKDWAGREDLNALVLGGAMPTYGGSDPEYSGKKVTILAREGHGYWVWYEKSGIEEVDRTNMDWYGRANRDILTGTYALAALPRQGPEPGPTIEPKQPEAIQVAIHGDMRSALRRFFEDRSGFEPHVLLGSSLEYLRQFGMVILQSARVPEAGTAEFRELLRAYVHGGGSLILAYDSIGALGSPFPDIVAGSQMPEAVAATGAQHKRRQDLVTHSMRRLITEDPALLAGLDGPEYSAHYPFHMPMVAGPEGTVVTTNRFDMPVIVIGRYGQGRVAVMGDFLGRRQQPTGNEAQLFANVFRSLTTGNR